MNRSQHFLGAVRGIGPERLKLLGVLTGGHFFVHWFQQLFPVILPTLKTGLALNDVQVGALNSARQFTMASLDLPLGILADSAVRQRALVLALALALMGAAYSLIGIAPVFVWALCGAGLVGLGTALWHPAAAASLSTRFPERRATALAIHGMGATVGDTLTPLGAGFLLVSFPWQKVLGFQILPATVLGFLVWRGLKNLFAERESPRQDSARMREITQLARNPVFLGISVATGLLQMGRLVVITFLPIYLQEHLHYSPFVLGMYIALLHAMGTISQPLMGFLSDRLGRKAVLFPSYIALGVLFLMLGIVTPGVPLALSIGAIGLFFYTLMNIAHAAAMDVAGSGIQASSYGLVSLLTHVVVFPTPMIAGFLIGLYGIRFAFLLAGSLVVLGGLVWLPFKLHGGSLQSKT